MKTTVKVLSSINSYKLSFTLFEPNVENNNNITILLAPAMAVKQHYYRKFAEYACNKGYYVITFDYLGIGESQADLKDQSITYLTWAHNIDQLLVWIKSNLKTKIYYIAHSAGGQLLGLAPSAKDLVSKAFIISAGVGYWRKWPFPRKYYILLSFYLILPISLKIYGYSPKFVMGEKVPISVIRQWLYWGRKKRFMMDDPTIQTYFNEFIFETEFINFSDDTYSPQKSSRVLASFYPEDKTKFNFYNPKQFNFKKIGHFGFFRSKFQDSLWTILNL